jgi:hypothetical protein
LARRAVAQTSEELIMDPLRDLRAGDDALRNVDPLTRARLRMEAGEAEESRAEAERVAQRREEHAMRLVAQDMRDRIELHQQGYLTREAQAVHQQAEAMRQARLVELRQELDKLEGRPWRAPTASDVERLAARAEVEAAAGRVVIEAAKSLRRRREIAALEAEIARSRPRQPPATAGGGLAPVDREAAPGPAPAIGGRVARRSAPSPQRREIPPLSAPQFAHLLPDGDW